MFRRQFLLTALALGITFLTAPRLIGGDNLPNDLPSLHQKYIEIQRQRLAAKARLDVLEEEENCLSRLEQRKDLDLAMQSDPSLWNKVDTRLQESHEHRRNALRELMKEKHQIWEEAIKEWTSATRALLDFQGERDATEKRLGVSLPISSYKPLSDPYLVGIVLWGAFAILIGGILAGHEARRQLRRRYRSNRIVGVICLFLLPLGIIGCGLGETPGDSLSSDGGTHVRDRLQKEIVRLETEVGELGRKAQKLTDDKIVKRHGDALAGFTKLLPEAQKIPFRQAEDEDLMEFRQLLIDARTTELAADSGARALTDLKGERDLLRQQVSASRTASLERSGMRVGACILFGVLAILPLVRARRALARQQKEEARKCPRCLAVDSLNPKEDAKVDPRYHQPKLMECAECTHEFRADYLKLPRFCFPTVGVYSSGKTHWLVTAYDQVKHNRVRGNAAIKKVPSSADEIFDVLVEMYLDQRNRRGTKHELHAPLTYHIADADPLGASQGLLNLFDFSGEMSAQNIRVDAIRRRALLMDGFFYFLDPTQMNKGNHKSSAPGTPSKVGMNEQIDALTNFYEEMCDMRRRPPGSRIEVPVAVCISKIDLLPGHCRDLIRELRNTRDQPPTLKLLQYRSNLCKKQLPMIFPGWDVERTLTERFGNNYLFFPLTPVSLEEGELGNVDLSNRTIAPFGILDPICWLLHTQGYRMFD